MTSTSKIISVEDAVSYLLADNDPDLSDSEFELSDNSSDENGENENGNMNKNTRKIRTRDGSNAVFRRTHRIRTRGHIGHINNSIGLEERDKILEESWSKVDREPHVQNFNGQPGLQVPFNKSNARIFRQAATCTKRCETVQSSSDPYEHHRVSIVSSFRHFL